MSLLRVSIFILLALAESPRADVTISVTDVPATTHGHFTSRIVGSNPADMRPNPCYQYAGCDLRFFTIDESWLPLGRHGYTTADGGSWKYRQGGPTTYRTLGEWVANVMNLERSGRDYLPMGLPGSNIPCVVLAAESFGSMIEGSIVSNCAKGIVQARSCDITPPTVDVDLSSTSAADVPWTDVPGVSIRCSQDTNVVIETNSGERIPLNNDSTSVAVLDWGRGPGKPGRMSLLGGRDTSVPLRVKTEGLAGRGAGVYRGTSVINVGYE